MTQTKILHQDQYSTVVQDRWEKNQKTVVYTYTKRVPGAMALIINPAGQLLLIKQFRHPIQAYQWGIPGGGIEPHETIETALAREVLEECGLRVKVIGQLGKFFPASSCLTEWEAFFVTTPIDQQSPHFEHQTDEEDFQSWKWVDISEALSMIDSGEIDDSATANVIQMLARRWSEFFRNYQ